MPVIVRPFSDHLVSLRHHFRPGSLPQDPGSIFDRNVGCHWTCPAAPVFAYQQQSPPIPLHLPPRTDPRQPQQRYIDHRETALRTTRKGKETVLKYERYVNLEKRSAAIWSRAVSTVHISGDAFGRMELSHS